MTCTSFPGLPLHLQDPHFISLHSFVGEHHIPLWVNGSLCWAASDRCLFLKTTVGVIASTCYRLTGKMNGFSFCEQIGGPFPRPVKDARMANGVIVSWNKYPKVIHFRLVLALDWKCCITQDYVSHGGTRLSSCSVNVNCSIPYSAPSCHPELKLSEASYLCVCVCV